MKKMILLVLVSLSTGCASTRWQKSGASQMDFANDKQFCTLYARALNENHTWSRGFTEAVKAKECLRERGWSS